MYKFFGQLTGVLLATRISPCMPLLHRALTHYFDLDAAFQSPLQMIGEFQRFMAITAVQPNVVMFQLLPTLVLIVLLSTLFIAGCSHLCGFLFQTCAERFGLVTKPALAYNAGNGSFSSTWLQKLFLKR